MDGNRRANLQQPENELLFKHIKYFQPTPLPLSSTEFHRVVLCRVTNVANRAARVANGFDNSRIEHTEFCRGLSSFSITLEPRSGFPPLNVQVLLASRTAFKNHSKIHVSSRMIFCFADSSMGPKVGWLPNPCPFS